MPGCGNGQIVTAARKQALDEHTAQCVLPSLGPLPGAGARGFDSRGVPSGGSLRAYSLLSGRAPAGTATLPGAGLRLSGNCLVRRRRRAFALKGPLRGS